jgi:thiosulfate dehydrogenase [quinone] large subunit
MTQTAIRKTDQASPVHPQLAEVGGSMITSTAAKALAVLRVSMGFVFLWAFLDKTFGLNYATPSAKAWINGGSPTKGFLSSVQVGPLQSFFHAIAGTWWANGLFMLGLLAIGVALIAGVAMRIAAISGVVMLAMMWLAEVPFAQFTSAGEPTGSPNPVADSHYIYAVVLIVLALTYAGTTWGLGRTWARLPFRPPQPLGPVAPGSTSRPRPTKSRPAPRRTVVRGRVPEQTSPDASVPPEPEVVAPSSGL